MQKGNGYGYIMAEMKGREVELVSKENKGITRKGLLSVGRNDGQLTEITLHIYISVLSGGWRREGA